MAEPSKLVASLRRAAKEMRAENQNGWPVLTDTAADALEALTARNAELEHENTLSMTTIALERERADAAEALAASALAPAQEGGE